MTKKLLTLLIIISTLGVFSSCEGPAGRDGEGSMIRIPLFTVEEGDWNWDPKADVYFYDIPVRELTRDVVLDGDVLTSMTVDKQTYFSLTRTDHFYVNKYFSETVAYHYRTGYVTITIGASDLFDDTPLTYQPPTYTFKITLIY